MTDTTEKPLSETLAPLIAEYASRLAVHAQYDATAQAVINRAIAREQASWTVSKADLEAAEKALDAALPADCEGMTIETLAGKLTIRRSSALEIADEGATVAKLEQLALAAEKRASLWDKAALKVLNIKQPEQPEPSIFVRIEKRPNREALETLNDDMLAFLGVKRITRVSWTFAPVKMKAPKAAKAGEKCEAKNETGGPDDAK